MRIFDRLKDHSPATIRWAGPLSLLLCAVVVYAPTFTAGFVWNDIDYVTAPHMQSLHGLWRIWFDVGATEQYYPLLHSAFWVEHRLWGDAALGYHLINIFLHVANAWLFVLLLQSLKIPGAWVAGFLFVLHPVHAESIAWISEQKNTLSTLFYLGAAIAYLDFDATRRTRGYWLGLLLFACAVEAKSVTGTLPAALLLILWWKRGTLSLRRDLLPLLPWLLIGASAGLFSGWVERTFVGADGSDFVLNTTQRFLLSGRTPWFYLSKLVFPVGLSFIYPRWQISGDDWTAWLYPCALVVILGVLCWYRKQNRGPLAAALLFLGTLFPVAGVFNIYAFIFSFVTDHFQYLPSLSLIALMGAGIAKAWHGADARGRNLLEGVGLVILVFVGAQTFRQTTAYDNIVTFYRTIIERNPQCWMARNNLGNEYFRRGREKEALDLYLSALQIRPNYAEAHENAALAYLKIGDFESAIAHSQKVAAIKFAQPGPEWKWGNALFVAGRYAEAARHFSTALILDPAYPSGHFNLAATLAKLGKNQEAIAHYEKAISQKPDHAEAHYNLGVILQGIGKTSDAIAHYKRALALKPDYLEAANNLATSLRSLGRASEAVTTLEKALSANPSFFEGQFNLALAFCDLGQTALSIEHFSRAVSLRPAFAPAHFQLAQALSVLGKNEEAKAHYAEAIRLDPTNHEAHNNLGSLLAESGQLNEALAQFQEAARLQPDYAAARFNVGFTFLKLGQFEPALENLSAAARLNRELPLLNYSIGMALAKLGRLKAAADALSQAVADNPNHADAHFLLGLVLLELNEPADAIPHFETVVKLQPTRADSHYQLALALKAVGKNSEALAHYQEAIRLQPNLPPIKFDAP